MTVHAAVEAVERRARRAGAQVFAASLGGRTARVIRETTTVPFWSGVPWTLVTVVASSPTADASQLQNLVDSVVRLLRDAGDLDRRGVGTVGGAALLVTRHVGADLGSSAVEPVQHGRVLVWPVVIDLDRRTVLRAPRRLRGGAGGAWIDRRITAAAESALRAGSAT